MALQNDFQRNFRIYITYIDGDGPFMRLSGQLDMRCGCIIETVLASSRKEFESGIGKVSASHIREGIICAAKYQDGAYYRAKVISTSNLSTGLVGVHFIDYGNKDIISVSEIRLLYCFDPQLMQLRGQATDFYLSKLVNPSGRWEEHILLKLNNFLCYYEYPATLDATTSTIPLISVNVQGKDLSANLVVKTNFVPIPVAQQVVAVLQYKPKHQPKPQQNTPCSVTPPAPKKASNTYHCKFLEENSKHEVFVSYAEEGPKIFAVQLLPDGKKLEKLTAELNDPPYGRLTKPPMIGTVCLGRRSQDRSICRAIIMNISRLQCMLFFVDFGFTEMVSYYDIYDIPEEFVEPDVFSMWFCLSGVKNLDMWPQLNEAFKQLVREEGLTLRVVHPEGPPLIQYGELYIGNKNVLDLLMLTVKEPLQFQWMRILTKGSKHSVLVSYIDSCLKFYVLLSDKIDELNAVMDSVKVHCERTSSPGQLPVGQACCAKFPIDGNWYRAVILRTDGRKIVVAYVDYGFEHEVDISDLRTITSDLIQLPAQAMKCALKGYEGKPVETNTSNQLEMLVQEKTLIAHIMGVLAGETMLVSLLDDTVSPPLDVAREIAQLSQPMSNHEPKATTLVRKDAPENFSSPEGSVPDDSRKNLKDERRGPRDDGEDFGQRSGSFRERDNKFKKQDEWEENKTDNWDSNSRSSRERPERRDFGGDRRDNWGDFSDNRGHRGEREDRGEGGERSNFTPRNRADGAKNDRNFGSKDSRSGRVGPAQVQYKELPNPVPLETPFTVPSVDANAQHEVSVTWITSPDSFYTQIMSLQPKFLEMMHKIPEVYKGVKPFTGVVPVGGSVLAKYPEDGVLYRATVVCVQPLGKYIVQYIDFGNKVLVDTCDIWQLDKQLMELPMMAVHCSLLGVAPKDGEWKVNKQIDLCFNAPRYQCVFQECVEEKHKVSLWNNGASVADMLIDKEYALAADLGSSVTLKDEAIDLTIIIGQQILCRVTHVESFEKFYVQLNLDKALLVESAIASYDTSLLTPLGADSLADGIHCIVRYDEKIYRAILSDVSNESNIKAVLPDYGISITTSLDKLTTRPTELSAHYYQSLECCLNNYTEESKTLLSLEELKLRITDKKLIACINGVDGIRLVTTLYEFETGNKVAIFEPDDGAYEVVQLCTRAVFNRNFGLANISHMESLNEIYLQKVADGDRIAVLLDNMYQFYEEGTLEQLTNFEEGAICAARSSDGNWYRATVISASETECKVHFPDYGNSETIVKESLKELDTKFYEPCALALVADLGLVELQDEAITKLKEWTEEKEVQVTLSFGSNGWLSSLHLDDVDLTMKLVNEKLATPQEGTNEEEAAEAPAEQPVSLPAGCTQVNIRHVDSRGQFRLQILDIIDEEDPQTLNETKFEVKADE